MVLESFIFGGLGSWGGGLRQPGPWRVAPSGGSTRPVWRGKVQYAAILLWRSPFPGSHGRAALLSRPPSAEAGISKGPDPGSGSLPAEPVGLHSLPVGHLGDARMVEATSDFLATLALRREVLSATTHSLPPASARMYRNAEFSTKT